MSFIFSHRKHRLTDYDIVLTQFGVVMHSNVSYCLSLIMPSVHYSKEFIFYSYHIMLL